MYICKNFKNNIMNKDYWNARYNSGLTSGAGSYGKLAKFKAKVLNEFVKNNKVKSVIELGCGDGNQLSLCNYPKYIGIDTAEKAVKICKDIFKGDKTKKFKTEYKNETAELVISLDVLFHLVELEDWKQYLNQLFTASTKYVIIYSSNAEPDPNVKYGLHFKLRPFTDYIAENFKDFRFIKQIINQYPYDPDKPTETSMSNFYIYEKK